MKTRISAIVGLLCVLSAPLSASAGDELPTMPSGTPELYLSFMAGVALPRSADATFQDGSTPPGVSNPLPDIDYAISHSWGGSAGIWFPTRNRLAGFDLGMEITGYVWYPDVELRSWFNNDPTGNFQRDGLANRGTTTEIGGIYVGPNFLIRYPMAISETYPNGRWFPYIGGGVGAHQMTMKPGGARGQSLFRAVTDQRDTTIGFQGVGGIKAHLFKYVAVFAEAKYLYAHHNGLSTDRFGNSGGGDIAVAPLPGNEIIVNPYSSQIGTILVHAGLSIHFNWEPADWGKE
jgi:opacity protein-like surface antigen